jgi:hypothetical protein
MPEWKQEIGDNNKPEKGQDTEIKMVKSNRKIKKEAHGNEQNGNKQEK